MHAAVIVIVIIVTIYISAMLAPAMHTTMGTMSMAISVCFIAGFAAILSHVTDSSHSGPRNSS